MAAKKKAVEVEEVKQEEQRPTFQGYFNEDDRENFVKFLNFVYSNMCLKDNPTPKEAQEFVGLIAKMSMLKKKIEDNILEVKRVLESGESK